MSWRGAGSGGKEIARFFRKFPGLVDKAGVSSEVASGNESFSSN